MGIDIKGTLAKPANAAKFTAAFIAAYTSPAFGARSKSEIDLLVFSSLIEAGAIDPEPRIRHSARPQHHARTGAHLDPELATANFSGRIKKPDIRQQL